MFLIDNPGIDKILVHGKDFMNNAGSIVKRTSAEISETFSEVASLSGESMNVRTIVKDIPAALVHMIRAKFNPIPTMSSAVSFSFRHQEQASSIITQILSERPECMQRLILDGFMNKTKNSEQILRVIA